MAPRKHKQNQVHGVSEAHLHYAPQQFQHQPHVAMASYEVDPNLQAQLTGPTQRSESELNLSVLMRYNSEICGIEHIAPYGVVYEWVADQNTWDKSGIEGSVFICKLRPTTLSDERYSIIVLNRRQLHNLDFELRSGSDVEFTDQYIILMDQTASGQTKIWGLWIFAEPAPSSTASQPQEVAEKVRDCLRKAEIGRNGSFQEVAQVDGQRQLNNSRQLNLTDLFGQKGPHPTTSTGFNAQVSSPTVHQSMFAHSADTAFFLTPASQNPQTTSSHPASGLMKTDESSSLSQREHLLSLFRQAGGSELHEPL